MSRCVPEVSSTAMVDVAFQTRSLVGLKTSKTLLAKQEGQAWDTFQQGMLGVELFGLDDTGGQH